MIQSFTGEYHFLSNFYPTPLEWGGLSWWTSEAAYQGAKSLDPTVRLEFSRIIEPARAKRQGKVIDLRPDWPTVKYDTMLEIVRAKFAQNDRIAKMLLATGDEYLEEGNWWGDRYWGVSPVGSGNGKNALGRILMTVRSELGGGPLTEFDLI
jgi:ribA/ribD-fused uncharacterized protein